MSDKINLGFIGAGGFSGGNIYPCLHYAPANRVAVCDKVEAKARDYADKFGFQKVYTDHRKMFDAEKLDAVMIIAGPEMHHKLSLDAMRAGLHVYVEKPPALTSRDALEMVKVSRETGKYLQVGFMKRFATGNLMAKDISQTKEFGKPLMLDVKYVSSEMHGDEVHFTRDYDVHPLDLVRFFLGDVDRLLCRRVAGAPGRIGHHISMRHKNGAVSYVNINTMQGWGNPGDRVELTGENQYVLVDNLVKVTLFRNPPAVWGDNRPTQFDLERDALTFEPNWLFCTAENGSFYHNGYAREVVHFARSVLENKFTGPDVVDGYKAVKLVEAVNESFQEEREVTVTYEV